MIAIVGATGTGKSALAISLAEAIRGRGGSAEIVNGDAMQLYRGMDIGTAKVPLEQRRGVPHHLLDVLDITETASAARYQRHARAVIDEIDSRDVTPILVGGSGLYISAVLYDFQFPGTDPAVRDRLEAEGARGGIEKLAARLHAVDPVAAAAIGPHNARRIVRALELHETTGRSTSGTLPNQAVPRVPTTVIGLTVSRDELRHRLNERVGEMWRAGLRDEVQRLVDRGLERGTTARRAIGYSQALAELNGELTTAEAIAQTQSLTRRFARRQVSWFRRYPRTVWLDHDHPELMDMVDTVYRGR